MKRQLFDEPPKLSQLDNSKHEDKAALLKKSQFRLLEGVKMGWRVKGLLLFCVVILCTQRQFYPWKRFLLTMCLFAGKKIPPLTSSNDNLRMLQKIQITDHHSGGERLVFCQSNWPVKEEVKKCHLNSI